MHSLTVQTKTEGRVALDGDAVDRLAHAWRGELLQPEDPDHEQARRVWNGLIDKRPALIARCAEAADVSAAVNFAREHDVLLSVKAKYDPDNLFHGALSIVPRP